MDDPVPYISASFFFRYRSSRENFLRSFIWFALGALLMGSLLVPTFFKFGLQAGLGGTGTAAVMNIGNVSKVLNPVEGILGRFLSFASFELPRFIGDNSARRWEVVKQHLWLSPIILFLVIVGIVQPIAMVILWFSKNSHEDWRAIKYLTLGTVLLLCVSFIFSMKAPASHTFYLTLPIAMIYSFYCWSSFLRKPSWQIFAVVVLTCGIVFHVAWQLITSRESHSMSIGEFQPRRSKSVIIGFWVNADWGPGTENSDKAATKSCQEGGRAVSFITSAFSNLGRPRRFKGTYRDQNKRAIP